MVSVEVPGTARYEPARCWREGERSQQPSPRRLRCQTCCDSHEHSSHPARGAQPFGGEGLGWGMVSMSYGQLRACLYIDFLRIPNTLTARGVAQTRIKSQDTHQDPSRSRDAESTWQLEATARASMTMLFESGVTIRLPPRLGILKGGPMKYGGRSATTTSG